jgi:16S rRNA (adenine1518-N6/adenine1519-N6)-dimethyltransferase
VKLSMMASRRSLGQHFLIDRRAARRIVGALDPRPGEAVLEIGPGRGALTGDLIRAAGRIAAVEFDPTLAARLRAEFDTQHLLLFEQDVLTLDPAAVLTALGAARSARLVVAGNLPYAISKPVVQKLIRQRGRIDRAVLMFQREVAERLTADPGGRHYGPLGILAGLSFRIEILFDLPPRAFAPPPRVVSAVTRWRESEDRRLSGDQEQRLRRVLAVCFARRRRTLRNNLRAAGVDASRLERLLAAVAVDGELRAEAVAPSAFVRLAALWDEPSLL